MDKKQMIDDIIAMIDGGMSEGVGHINIKVDEDGTVQKDVTTMGCPDCSINDMACSIPTLHRGIDDEEE